MTRLNILLVLIIFWVFRNTILTRGRTDYATIDIYGLVQIGAVFLIAGLLFILYTNATKKTIYQINRSPAKWLFLLYLFGLISSLWSPLPLYSGYRAFEALVLFFGIFVLFYNLKNFEQAEKYFLRLSLLFLILSVVGQIKSWGFQISLTSLHTNGYSFISMILFLYAFGELLFKKEKSKKRKKALKRYAMVGLFFIALGTSAATNIATAVGLILLAVFTNRKDLKVALALIVMPLLILFLLLTDISLIQEILFPGKSLEGISSMTGRVNIWNQYFPMIYEKIYFGWGFSIINRISDLYAINTHNSFISVLGGMGIVGVVLFIVFILSSIRSILNLRSKLTIGSLGSGAAFAGLLVNSMSVGVIGETVFTVTLVIALLMAFLFITVRRTTYMNTSVKEIS